MASHLVIIIVSWNTRELLRRCIASVQESLAGAGVVYRVIVVDNASEDGTPAMLRAEFPAVDLIESGRNLGFAGGNNLALRRLFGAYHQQREHADSRGVQVGDRPAPPEYVLLLNSDTEVTADAILRMLRYLEAHPDVAVIGPQLRYGDGSAQPSRRRFPTRATFFWESTPLEPFWPTNPWAQRYRIADRADDCEQTVDWLVGAALLVRRTAIERAGLLDAGFAMYSEELEWQHRIAQQPADAGPNARRIVYLPAAGIIHHEGQSSTHTPARRYITFQRSRIRLAQMWYGARFAALLRAFFLAAYSLELLTEALKWLLGHKRALRAERIRIYVQVLRGIAAR